jgi:hypothetical protein
VKRHSLPRVRATSPFALLNDQHQRESILRLADSRVSDHVISSLTGMDVATVRRIIATRAVVLRTKGEVGT